MQLCRSAKGKYIVTKLLLVCIYVWKKFSKFGCILFAYRWRVIPFLTELRCLMDWIWTDTTLSLTHWLEVEDIYAQVYPTKCFRNRERVSIAPLRGVNRKLPFCGGGGKRGWVVKFGYLRSGLQHQVLQDQREGQYRTPRGVNRKLRFCGRGVREGGGRTWISMLRFTPTKCFRNTERVSIAPLEGPIGYYRFVGVEEGGV